MYLVDLVQRTLARNGNTRGIEALQQALEEAAGGQQQRRVTWQQFRVACAQPALALPLSDADRRHLFEYITGCCVGLDGRSLYSSSSGSAPATADIAACVRVLTPSAQALQAAAAADAAAVAAAAAAAASIATAAAAAARGGAAQQAHALWSAPMQRMQGTMPAAM